MGRRQFMRSALKNKSSKGQTKRFLNNATGRDVLWVFL